MSALETIQTKFSRRAFFRGAIAAVPLAAIPAGAALADTAQMPAAAKEAICCWMNMHDRALALGKEWRRSAA